MKHIVRLLILLISLNVYAQELTLNESTNFYEFSKVVESNHNDIKSKLTERFNEINLEDIVKTENAIKGKGFTNHLVGGFATVEIHYFVKIEFKNNRYKLTLTNFKLTDRNGTNPLEGMRSFKKTWIRKINKKLPEIISNIEKINEGLNDW